MKKLLKVIPIVTGALFCAVAAVACAPSGLEAHSYAKGWTSNINYHWHACLNAGCNERGEYAKHNWVVNVEYEEASCGSNGAGQYICSDCKATLGNLAHPATIPATGEHDYELDEVILESNCGEDGYGAYICADCNDYAIFPIPATGEHDYSGAYTTTQEGHYHVCKNGCGVDEELQPHVKGEGIRFEPVGSQDGRIEYRCTVCNYLMETEVIENPNILDHIEVKFVRNSNSSEIAVPQLGADGELWVYLQRSSNAAAGYTVEVTGYTAAGNVVEAPTPTFYYLNEYTGQRTALDLTISGTEAVGYLGYLNNWFYVAQNVANSTLLIECSERGREPVTLTVHITTNAANIPTANVSLSNEVSLYIEDKKNY